MDAKKLHIAGKEAASEPLASAATYKQIAEHDTDEHALSRPRSLVKAASNGNETDGADERMLPDEDAKVARNSSINLTEIKFTNNEKQNGDAKLDIGDLKTGTMGMGKEELMKYANDPFWVRLRWFLFILFWVLWAGMLVGAVLIIVAAPKCDPPAPKTWWEEGPLIELEADYPGDVKQLKSDGVSGVVIEYPHDTYKALNASESFGNLLKELKKNDINIIVELTPVASYEWFKQSEDKVVEYSDYYVWTGSEGDSSKFPNNWLLRNSSDDNPQSAWKYSPIRKQFHLRYDDRPHLNFRSTAVQKHFTDVLAAFLDAGVKGFRLNGVSNLVVDPTFSNETILMVASSISQSDYNFYAHFKTENLPEITPVLKSWRDLIKGRVPDGVLMLGDDLTSLEVYKSNGSSLIDLPQFSKLFVDDELTASKLRDNLETTFKIVGDGWPSWKIPSSKLPDDVMLPVVYLLKGSLFSEKNVTLPPELKEPRKSNSIIYGSQEFFAIANNTVFAYVREHSGNPGYVVALNPTDDSVEVNFTKELPSLSNVSELTIQYLSNTYNGTDYVLRMKLDASKVTLKPQSSVVLSYVPKPKTE